MLMTGTWLPENRAALEDLLRRVGRGGPEYRADAPPFAVFDWDQTVIRHDIGDALFLHQIEALGFALDHDEFWTVLDPSDVTLREQAALLRELADDARADHPTFHALREAVLVGFLRSGLLDPQEGFPWQTRLLAGMSEAEIADLTRQAMEKFFADHRFEPRITMEMGSNETIKQAVMAGMGVSFLSLHTIGLELRNNLLSLLDVSGTPLIRSWNLVHLHSKVLSPAAEAFRYFVLERARDFLLEHDRGLLGQAS